MGMHPREILSECEDIRKGAKQLELLDLDGLCGLLRRLMRMMDGEDMPALVREKKRLGELLVLLETGKFPEPTLPDYHRKCMWVGFVELVHLALKKLRVQTVPGVMVIPGRNPEMFEKVDGLLSKFYLGDYRILRPQGLERRTIQGISEESYSSDWYYDVLKEMRVVITLLSKADTFWVPRPSKDQQDAHYRWELLMSTVKRRPPNLVIVLHDGSFELPILIAQTAYINLNRGVGGLYFISRNLKANGIRRKD